MSNDLDIFARTIYGEARGESIAGKVAVANIVLNRVKIAKKHHGVNYGDGTIAGCCKAPWQFSCWNQFDANFKIISEVDHTDYCFNVCLALSKAAIDSLLIDNTNNSTHYHATSMGFPKAWKRPGHEDPAPTIIIGNHSFYNNVK